MAKTISGAQAIIGVVARSTMGYMPITKLAIMTLGDLVWMNVAKMATRTMVNQKRQKRLHPNLQKVLLRNLLSMTNFAMGSALRLAFPLKQSIESGRMPRETSRSESQVE
jgi:hypothetical protein